MTRRLIHPELSYLVRGVLLDVYNALGPMLKEEYYRDAIVLGVEKRGIACEAEKAFEFPWHQACNNASPSQIESSRNE